ncbi:MAG: ribosome silencing factor [Planctomycetia bacterium]|nr:ribosome silencing factor [Planctomycetia bacterium]
MSASKNGLPEGKEKTEKTKAVKGEDPSNKDISASKSTVKSAKKSAGKPSVKKATVKKSAAGRSVGKKTAGKRSSVKKSAVKKPAEKRTPARNLDIEKETSIAPPRSNVEIVRTRTDLPEAIERAKIAAKIIEENKGTDIKILDLREITQAFDFFVIASGASRRQLHAISDEIDDVFEKKLKDTRRGINGYQESRWIVLDYDDIVIHLFDPDVRDFYALEELWGKGSVVPY